MDKSRLSNFKNLDPKLMNPAFDPGNTYSVPYMWGTTAIAVNNKLVQPPGSVTRWADPGTPASRVPSCFWTTFGTSSPWP